MSKRSASGKADTASKKQKSSESTELKYMSGFGCEFDSEALPGALPKGQLTPQKYSPFPSSSHLHHEYLFFQHPNCRCPYGLYAEQLSGMAFTVPRHAQQRSWLYRILPSAKHNSWSPMPGKTDISGVFQNTTPAQLRWKPFPLPSADEKIDFVEVLTRLLLLLYAALI